ncbi:hypothetical protein [Pluralibacter gergoviae]|uniref:hypothetical protein n=1 Tax=Pluralibacter gergoviae TaxID=61647 RepID=UPI00069D93A7
MTDITELAQREKFEAWFVNDVVGADVTFPAFEDGAYAEGEIYDEQLYFMLQAMWMAWKAAGAELVEALEKAQQRIDSQREYYEGVITDGGKRIAELEESHAQVIQSRDHYKRMTEEGLKQLAEARTVKLPPCVDDLHGIGMVMSADAVIEALTVAGIKVEAE